MRLRGRFTLTLAIAALVPISVAAVVTRQVIATSRSDAVEDRKTSAKAALTAALMSHRVGVKAVIDSLVAEDHPYVKGDLREYAKGLIPISAVQTRAKAYQRGLALDVFTIVDDSRPENLVLVSAHHPAAANHVDDNQLRKQAEKQERRRDEYEKQRAKEKDKERDQDEEAAIATYYAIVQVKPEGNRPVGVRETEPIVAAVSARLATDTNSSYAMLAGRGVPPNLIHIVYNQDRVDARLVDKDRKKVFIKSKGLDWDTLAADSLEEIELKDHNDQTIAIVQIAVSRLDLDKVLRKLTYTSVGLALAALGAVVLIGLFVARRTARDLDALVEGSLAAARGDLDHRVPVRSKDEVGAVANAFNFMMEDLRTSKDRLVIAERIAAWQDIARRLAHEIKNPLTPIQMAMDTLRKTHRLKHPSFDEILEESTATVLEEADRLKKIVAEFSDFARMPKPSYQRLDLNEVIRSSVALYKGSVEVDAKLTPLPQIDADKGQLSQVVLNLVENARDAIGTRPDGRILISTKLGEAGDRAMLVIEDNGPGVPSELKEKVFTPYFTTKHAKGGTGLGLAIVHRIVSDHGGRIALSDAPGGGARFSIELPLRNGTALLVSRI